MFKKPVGTRSATTLIQLSQFVSRLTGFANNDNCICSSPFHTTKPTGNCSLFELSTLLITQIQGSYKESSQPTKRCVLCYVEHILNLLKACHTHSLVILFPCQCMISSIPTCCTLNASKSHFILEHNPRDHSPSSSYRADTSPSTFVGSSLKPSPTSIGCVTINDSCLYL